MSRIARVTADLGSSDDGFYVERPDIPEGLTCRDWRCRRVELLSTTRPRRKRAVLRWTAPRVALP
jgi:hypothetical protein